jgi:hypothetical protein
MRITTTWWIDDPNFQPAAYEGIFDWSEQLG